MLSILATEEGVHHENGWHLGGDTNEVIWGSLAFFVVLGLLYKYAFPAMKAGLKGRTDRISAELSAAALARVDAETALTASTQELPDVSTEGTRLMAESEETAEKLKADIVAKAHNDAEQLKIRAASDISNQTSQALADIRDEVARLTRGATEKVVESNLNPTSQSDLIDAYIAKVGG
jgi:F-type H+-transporting ATPase subunit b